MFEKSWQITTELGQLLSVFSLFPLGVLGWLSLKRPAAGWKRANGSILHRSAATALSLTLKNSALRDGNIVVSTSTSAENFTGSFKKM